MARSEEGSGGAYEQGRGGIPAWRWAGLSATSLTSVAGALLCCAIGYCGCHVVAAATSCCALLLRSWDLAEYIVNLDMDICMWLELGDRPADRQCSLLGLLLCC
jgi:hypothetical protein